MKEAALFVLIAVLAVGGIGLWLTNNGSPSFFGSQPSSAQPADEATQAAAAAKEAQEAKEAEASKKVRVAKAARNANVAPVEAAVPPIRPVAEVVVEPPAAPPPPAPKQFPEPREISVGSERDNIAERFGQPALSTTTTSDHGRVMETLVYARKSGRDVTLIRIEDGKVLSAHSR